MVRGLAGPVPAVVSRYTERTSMPIRSVLLAAMRPRSARRQRGVPYWLVVVAADASFGGPLRVAYQPHAASGWVLVQLGQRLRRVHLHRAPVCVSVAHLGHDRAFVQRVGQWGALRLVVVPADAQPSRALRVAHQPHATGGAGRGPIGAAPPSSIPGPRRRARTAMASNGSAPCTRRRVGRSP